MIKFHYGYTIPITHDTMLLAYFCSSASELINNRGKWLGLKPCAMRLLGVEDWDVSLSKKTSKSKEDVAKYLGYDVYYTRKIYEVLRRTIDPLDIKSYQLTLKVTEVYRDVEVNGVPINVEQLKDTLEEYEETLQDIDLQLRSYADINWNSPKQLQDLLYNQLKLPIPCYTDSGQPGTGIEALSKLGGKHPIVGPFGNLQGLLGPDRSYTWTDTVPINRGNSRKGTLDVVVGLEYKGNDQRFGSALQTLRLETAEIPVANIQSFSGSADGGNVTGDRYIRLACKFTNPEGYYQCRLYDANGTNLKTVGGTSLEHNILITKDMYQTTRRFIVELYGRDNSRYDRREITVSIEPSGAGLWVKENSIAREVNKTTFRNVNHKEVKEVWIKKDGKWRKTRK